MKMTIPLENTRDVKTRKSHTCKILLKPFGVLGTYVTIPPPRIAFRVTIHKSSHFSQQNSTLRNQNVQIQKSLSQCQVHQILLYKFLNFGRRKWQGLSFHNNKQVDQSHKRQIQKNTIETNYQVNGGQIRDKNN